jgi:cell division protease FtsH
VSNWQQHQSNPAKPGSPRGPVLPPAPPRPPRWRIWLLVGGLLLTVSLFGRPAMTGAVPTRAFSFTNFVTQVDTNHVRTASIDPTGEVAGLLTNGDRYTSQVPTAVPDTQLSTQLLAHKVQVTGTVAGSVSLLGVIFDLLPLLLAAPRPVFTSSMTAPRRALVMSLAITVPNRKWQRWSTSSRTPPSTGAPALSGPVECLWSALPVRARR